MVKSQEWSGYEPGTNIYFFAESAHYIPPQICPCRREGLSAHVRDLKLTWFDCGKHSELTVWIMFVQSSQRLCAHSAVMHCPNTLPVSRPRIQPSLHSILGMLRPRQEIAVVNCHLKPQQTLHFQLLWEAALVCSCLQVWKNAKE